MFGRNDFVENVKSALAAVDCDMGAFRSWQKMYDKLKKKKSEQEDRYRRCREQTKRVQEDAQLMEHMLTTAQSVDGKEFGRLLKDLRQMQNSFDHEFLVSKEDQEFHSTYDTILRLGTKALNAPDQKLLLQSEIENLLALLKENLEKEEPEIAALTFYYQFGSDQELAQLPPAEKLSKITYLYECEFRRPILQLLESGISGPESRNIYMKLQQTVAAEKNMKRCRFFWCTSGTYFRTDDGRIKKQEDSYGTQTIAGRKIPAL